MAAWKSDFPECDKKSRAEDQVIGMMSDLQALQETLRCEVLRSLALRCLDLVILQRRCVKRQCVQDIWCSSRQLGQQTESSFYYLATCVTSVSARKKLDSWT